MNLFRAKIKFPGKRIALLLLLLILASGAFLRFYKLDFQSLDNDELSSWNLSKEASSVADVIKNQAETDVNPPGYQIILFFVIHYLGETEFWLRLPSAIAGIASIYVIYLLGKRLYGLKEGLSAAAMMAFLWNPIYFSQEARSYSLLILFSMLSVYFWLYILEREVSKKNYPYILLYTISAGVTMSLHYFGVLIIFLQAAGMLLYSLFDKRILKKFLAAYGVLIIISISLVPALITDFNPSYHTFIKKPGLHAVFDLLFSFFNSSPWFVYLAVMLYLFLLGRIFYEILKNKKEQREPSQEKSGSNIITFAWLTVPFIAAYILSVLFLPVLTERNLIISLPPAYLLFSRSLTQLPLKEWKKVFLTFFIIFLFLFHLIARKDYYRRPDKVQFRETAQFIAENSDPNSNPAIISFSWGKSKFEYYLKRMNTNMYISKILGKKEDIDSLEDFIYDNNIDSFWYVYGHRNPEREFLDSLNSNFTLIKKQLFYGAGAYFYRADL